MSTPGSAAAGPALDEELFARDLGLMLQSGLSLMDALKTLRERAAGATAQALDALVRRLMQGEPLSRAMQGCGGFRAGLLASVRASELTGDLAESLARYAANASRLRGLRSRISSALVYPAVLVVVAALVVVFLLLVVVPRFAVVLETSGQDLPAASRALIVTGRTLHDLPTLAWLVIGAALAWGGWHLWTLVRGRRLEAALADAAARLPGLRELARAFGQSQFARSGATLVRSGVPALKALAMCRELLAGADRPALDRALVAAGGGAPLAASLHDQGLLDTLGLRVLRVAERTGELATALDRLADLHDHALERALDRIGRLVEPALMLGIGLVVGGIVVLMYMPIFQLAAAF